MKVGGTVKEKELALESFEDQISVLLQPYPQDTMELAPSMLQVALKLELDPFGVAVQVGNLQAEAAEYELLAELSLAKLGHIFSPFA